MTNFSSESGKSNDNSRRLREERLLIQQEKLRRLASTSLHEFVAQAWHVVEPATPFLDNWHVGAICSHLEAVTSGQIRRLVVNIPPRFLKSTICSVMWPAYEWVHAPAVKWLTGSYAMRLAIRDNLKMRRLIQSPWYRERWGRRFSLIDNSDWGDPDGFELTGDQNQKMRFENDRSGYRIAFSFEGGVMGEGGDRVLIDDPHDREKAHSDTEREHSLTTFNEAITTRLNDPAKSPIVIIMQRLHEHDLSGHVLSKNLGYEHLLIPMHYDPARSKVTSIGWKDPRTEAGELLHEARFPESVIEEWETFLGSYAAAGQLEQAPAPAEGGILKPIWWRFYNDDELPTKFDTEIQSWDLAFKGTKTSNFVAGQAWGKIAARIYMMPDEVYAQLDFVQTCDAFRAFTLRHPCPKKLVEDKANGPAVMSTLSREIPGIIGFNEGGVEAIANAVSPYVEAGNVWLPNPCNSRADGEGRVAPGSSVRTDRQWVMRFMQNAATFPNGSMPAGSHGDDVAAAVQAIHYLMNKKVSRIL